MLPKKTLATLYVLVGRYYRNVDIIFSTRSFLRLFAHFRYMHHTIVSVSSDFLMKPPLTYYRT